PHQGRAPGRPRPTTAAETAAVQLPAEPPAESGPGKARLRRLGAGPGRVLHSAPGGLPGAHGYLGAGDAVLHAPVGPGRVGPGCLRYGQEAAQGGLRRVAGPFRFDLLRGRVTAADLPQGLSAHPERTEP